MTTVLVIPVAVPLGLAALSILFRRKFHVRRAMALAGAGAVIGSGIALTVGTFGGTVIATQISNWPPPFAIPFVADPFAALMLLVTGVVIFASLVFAAGREEDRTPFFHPLALVLMAGIGGAFLTGDLFNLFVFFEVMLIASYVLVTVSGGRRQVRGGAVYVTANLMASTVLLAGVALTYGIAGTVNLAELGAGAGARGALPVAGGLLLVAFAVKGSLVPVHGWLPVAYPSASPAVAALFSGVLTKVGIYALYRVYSVVFGGASAYRGLLLAVAAATMLLGVLGAIGRTRIRSILSFHIVSQVGYMVMGLGLFGVLGLTGGIFYILHHIVVKTSLFLSAGAVETMEGTGSLGRLGGAARKHPILAAAFALAALSLAGLPPLSGFFAKLILIQAAFDLRSYAVAAVAIVVSLLTLASMLKIWNGVFWGAPAKQPAAARQPVVAGAAPGPSLLRRAALVGPAAALALLSLAIGLGAQGLVVLSEGAAEVLVDPTPYIEAVLTP